jgi:hypothetical protein
MYKSSNLTFFYKYIFVPIWLFGYLWMKFNHLNNYSELKYFEILILWPLSWMTVLMIRLRNIEVTDNFIVIKSFRKQHKVAFKDIEYVSQPLLISPKIVSLKYNDIETNETKKILFMLSLRSVLFDLFEEADITKLIRAKIISENKSYTEANSPYRWLPIAYIFLTGLPILLFILLF